MSVNKVILIGRTSKKPETKQTANGQVSTFSIAIDESYKDKSGNKVEQTEWVNIILWNKLSEIADKWVEKGHLLYIEGRLKTRSWDDKEGKKHYATEVIGERMEMLSKPKTEGEQLPTYQSANYEQPEPEKPEDYDDNLPF